MTNCMIWRFPRDEIKFLYGSRKTVLNYPQRHEMTDVTVYLWNSTCGIVFLTLQGAVFQGASEIPVGAIWAVCGGLLFAVYLVMLRRRAESEDKLNIPMFLGEFYRSPNWNSKRVFLVTDQARTLVHSTSQCLMLSILHVVSSQIILSFKGFETRLYFSVFKVLWVFLRVCYFGPVFS